jgi:glycosyltransferase involved in cell wall biosynthesis
VKTLRILGIRGIPAAHGGFETFAEALAPYLVAQGWRVVVYCQQDGEGPVHSDNWQGIERVHIPVKQAGALGTIVFDWLSVAHAAQHRDLCLTLGYNTAVFCARLRLAGVPNVINMDGIEWHRAKWGAIAKTWFWLNERAGCWLGDHLVADHPEIKAHLATRVDGDKITTIPYGADALAGADATLLKPYGLAPGSYLTLIARPEPENSILEAVAGFSARKRGVSLVVLGRYDAGVAYHRKVQEAAGPEVQFVGAIYEKQIVQALRFHSLAYVHGHQVGGTNPSLVEALGAGNGVLAHDNRFNRWVAGSGARYFADASSFDAAVTAVLADATLAADMRAASLLRFQDGLTWPSVLQRYEELLTRFVPRAAVTA